MKRLSLLLLLTLFMSAASAGFIPASINGHLESGDNVWEFTDTNNVKDDAGYFLDAQFGGSNSIGTRSFGMYQFDTVTFTKTNELQIFDDATLLAANGSANVN